MRIGCFTITAAALAQPGLEEVIRSEILITYQAFHSGADCWCFIGTFPGFRNLPRADYSIPVYDMAFNYQEMVDLMSGKHARMWTQILVSPRKDIGDFLPPSLMGIRS